jgi:hypothetical protein
MSLRSWIIRGLIFLAGMAALAISGWLITSWVSPERVRTDVIDALSKQFEGDSVQIEVGSASLRILGGISVTDLKLTRKGAAGPFFTVPAAILYHDKEQLNRGRLVIKRIELENPELNLERSPDGQWNVEGIGTDGPADRPVPTFLIKNGTVRLHDRGPDPLPEVTVSGVQLTLLNDPIPVLAFQARGVAKGFGPVEVRARLDRIKSQFSVGLEFGNVPLGEVVARTADRLSPGLSAQLAGLTATATVRADLTCAKTAKSWQLHQHHVCLDLKDGRYTHPELPWPVEGIVASVQLVDGRLSVKDAGARLGPARVKLSLESRAEGGAPDEVPAEADDALKRLERHLEGLDLTVDDLPLDDTLFRALPARAQRMREKLSPVGHVNLSYKFSRRKKVEGGEKAGWVRELKLSPQQVGMTYFQFKYPVKELCGTVKRTVKDSAGPVTTLALTGTAGDQKITIDGQITGEGEDPGINLKVSGVNVPINDTLVKAFPPRYAELVNRFGAEGRGDFVAEFVQAEGVNLCENEFRIEVRDARIRHKEFPYSLDKVKGRLIVRVAVVDPRPGEDVAGRPDRDEIILDGFTAVHDGAAVSLTGSRRPIPGSRDKKLVLHVAANNCPVDDDLKAIVHAFKIDSVRRTFNPRGKLTFTADLELTDRAAPPGRPDHEAALNPATDLKLTFLFQGATVRPNFFPYDLTDFSGSLKYEAGMVKLDNFAGRHGETYLKLEKGEAKFCPNGQVWANLGHMEIKPLIADEEFIRALPGQLSAGMREFKLKGGTELVMNQLVVLTPPDAPPLTAAAARVTHSMYNAPVARASGSELPPAAAAVPFDPAAPPPRAPSPVAPAPPDPIVYWDLELRLLSASFDTGVTWEQAFGTIACKGRYENTHLGQVRGGFLVDSTSIAGQPVTKILGHFGADEQKPDPLRPGEFLAPVLEFPNLSGKLFHGDLGGQARVALTSPVRFALWLQASDVQLDDVARHFKSTLGSDADLKGIAQAKLLLRNRPDAVTGRLVVEGDGEINVPTGRMFNLPILLDLVKLFKFGPADKTAFEEAHAIFHILGDRVKVDQIDLIGRAVCLGGSGEFDTSGNFVRFDFYTIFSQVLAKLINTPVGDLTAFLSQNLFVIRLTRENGELKYKQDVIPVVSELARSVADRLRSRVAKMVSPK